MVKNIFGLQFSLLNNLNQKLYFIVGPTGIGKSSLAIRLALKINAVIINSDSMQVYSNLKILTARPSEEDCKKIKHKLYGYIEGSRRYNVANWCNDILEIIHQNEKNNIPSIIVGGTGMYINSLLNGLINLPSISENYKKESKEILDKKGLDSFVKIISIFDSDSLINISLTDTSRLRRVWEIYQATGITYSQWKLQNNKKFLINYKSKILLFTPPRDIIYKNVNTRFQKMINEGAIEEVRNLLSLNLEKSLPLMRAHGVPEISKFLLNRITLNECIEKGQQVTRNYVKRQLTWWRSTTLTIDQVFNDFPNEIDENLIKI